VSATEAATSRQVRFQGEGRIVTEEVPLTSPGPGRARVRVHVCALCGSDKRLLASGSDCVPGHEIAGVVDAVGTGADIAVGQRVLVYIPVFCGTCDQCRRGQTNRCLNLDGLIGWQHDGGYAQHVQVPARCLLAVPDDVPLDIAALGLDTLGTAAHGLRLVMTTQQDVRDLAVIGCGPLGMGVIAVAAAMGLPQPSAYDPHPGRLATAVALGARPLDDLETLNQADIVVEVSGAEPAREAAQRLVRPGGAVLALGESNQPYTMAATPRWRRTDCFTVRSFYFPLTEVSDNWDLLRTNGAALRDQLCVPVPLEDLAQAFERFVAGDYLKPCIVFPEES
jgi:threonine dehydrogenase-like Zn-dependent dehydrogenase